jgi:septal ring factor EnvC (AmiA/AmiB activator)
MGAAAAEPGALAEKQSQSRGEYERVREEIRLSDERAAQLAAEIATVRKDHATLTAELVRSAAAERRLGEEIDAVIARLEPLHAQSDAIKRSLAERRDVLAEVLGALQRMGLNPPPALMVRPEDALGSVRSAILLGAVVPGLRAETDRMLAISTRWNWWPRRSGARRSACARQPKASSRRSGGFPCCSARRSGCAA